MKRILLLTVGLFIGTIAFAKKTVLVIKTTYGDIEMELSDYTPKHRDNMIKLAKEHFFDSTLFHRCIPGFVIQGGDPTSKNTTPGAHLGEGDLGYRVPAEINDSDYHRRGAVGMARDNNPDKSSSACQFYIVVGKKFDDAQLAAAEQRSGHKMPESHKQVYKTEGGTPHLDGGYTVLGYVTKGMDVVDKIANEARNTEDRPNNDVRMISVRIKKKKFLGIF